MATVPVRRTLTTPSAPSIDSTRMTYVAVQVQHET